MCGIVGIVGKKDNDVNAETIKKMADKISHRGPDSEGYYVDGNVGLGHRRLSIIDLNSHGSQPMKSNGGDYVIVFNGEIYNYLELKEELEKMGSVFKTQTDTEVALESYIKWGCECFRRFNGMWSICIYDKKKKQIILSRDRFGVKPLYILERNDYFAFASEIKCITEVFPEERKVDIVQVARYLRGIQEDCDEHTFYEHIRNFPTASYVIYDLTKHEYTTAVFWRLDASTFEKKWSSRSAIKKCRELLEDSIRLRLRADVPVGASLSGGLDSSSIVEIVKKAFGIRMHTFSSIYSGEGYDEKDFIDCVNMDADTIFNYVYPCNNHDVLEDMKLMLYFHDGPLIGASPYSGFNVYRLAKDYVKVLLDGQGADELFVGYYYFLDGIIKNAVDRGGLIGKIRAIKEIAIVSTNWPKQKMIADSTAVKVLGVSTFKFYNKGFRNNKKIDWKSDKELYSEKIQNIDLELRFKDEEDIPEGLLRRQYHEQFHGELPRILHDVDRNSMAHSLEVRLPFLDYRLVEFAYSISANMKYYNGWTKYVLRKAVKPYLPKKIWSRRNKMGFPAPFDRWMRDNKYKERIRKWLSDLGDRSLVNRKYLLDLFDEQVEGIRNTPDLFFRFMMLEMWLQAEIDTKERKWSL